MMFSEVTDNSNDSHLEFAISHLKSSTNISITMS